MEKGSQSDRGSFPDGLPDSPTASAAMQFPNSETRALGEDKSTGTIGKALSVLDVIADSKQPPRFTDILNVLDQPRGTLHRQIKNLIEEDLVVVNLDGSYGLGPRLLRLAKQAWSGDQFRSIAEPYLRWLHEVTGETVHLGLLRDIEVIYLDKVESKKAVRMYSHIGNASPVYCTGIGKAMLSVLPDRVLEDCASRIDYQVHTPTTLSSAEALIADIMNIRKSGISIDREEHETGIRCVAAPIRLSNESLIAGVSITAPAYRVEQQQIKEWSSLVLRAASAIQNDADKRLGPRNRE